MESNLCSFLLQKTHSCSLLSPHQVRVTMEPCSEEQGAPPKNSHINQLGQEARCAPSFPSAEYSVSHTIYITAFQWPPCWLARWDRHSRSLIPLTNLIRTIRFHLAQRSTMLRRTGKVSPFLPTGQCNLWHILPQAASTNALGKRPGLL